MNPISGYSNVAKFITKMTKHDAMAPIVALEACVVTGRTYQAYKRGKWDEARERFIEETMGSITWLLGVKTLNALGDKLLAKIFKSNGKNFDVGTDGVLRTPFENFMKKNPKPRGLSANQVAAIKSAKVCISIILTNLFIGFVVPKLNQALTKKLRKERKQEMRQNVNQQPAFKGGMGAVNAFTHIIENTNTGQLLSSDAGIAGGRMYNARSKEERREIAIRDLGSIYFYMWARGHVGNLMNLAESGKATRLNSTTAELLDKHLVKILEENGNSMTVDKFREICLGKDKPEPSSKLNFEQEKLSSISKFFGKKPVEVTTLANFEKIYRDSSDIVNRAREMSKLQPLRQGEAVLTRQQALDSLTEAKLSDPKFLDEIFSEFTQGANKDEYKFVSNKSLYKLKSEMEQYVEIVCKAAKDGKIDKKLLETTKKKNLMYNGINFAAGFALAAAFLSTFIPKIQYYVTKRATGVDAFPGVYDFEKHKEVDD